MDPGPEKLFLGLGESFSLYSSLSSLLTWPAKTIIGNSDNDFFDVVSGQQTTAQNQLLAEVNGILMGIKCAERPQGCI